MKDMYDDKDLQRLYDEEYFANRSRPPMWVRRAEFIVEKFNPLTFLDIGCAYGELVKALKLADDRSKWYSAKIFEKINSIIQQENIENIKCYSNEEDKWEKSTINIFNQVLTIKFRGPFKPRRGRINCSLNDNGKWRWFGIQFPIQGVK